MQIIKVKTLFLLYIIHIFNLSFKFFDLVRIVKEFISMSISISISMSSVYLPQTFPAYWSLKVKYVYRESQLKNVKPIYLALHGMQ